MYLFEISSDFYIKIIISISIILAILVICSFITFDINSMRKNFIGSIIRGINTYIKKQEEDMRNKMFKGQMNPLYYKWNRFMNGLKIDIPVFETIPVTQFKWLLYIISVVSSIIISFILFNNILLFPILAIIILTMILCYLYSSTVRRRYNRLVDSITTENILSGNMDTGFLADVKMHINNIPSSIRKQYQQYVMNIEKLNYPSEEALKILDLDIGGYSSDFLNNVNIYENYREEGFINVFKDVVELNNIRKIARDKMEALMQRITIDFNIAFIISYGLFLVCLVCIPYFRKFYLETTPGQVIFIINLIILAVVYLRLATLKAEEL